MLHVFENLRRHAPELSWRQPYRKGCGLNCGCVPARQGPAGQPERDEIRCSASAKAPAAPASPPHPCCPRRPAPAPTSPARSEEHTSELQSLMRISYAVFCLKKKKLSNINPTET